VLALLLGCGRIDFDPLGSSPDDGRPTDVTDVTDGFEPSGETIAFVQVTSTTLQSALSVDASLVVTSGNLIVAAIDYAPQTRVATVADNQDNTYTLLGPFDGPGNPANRQYVAYAIASTSGTLACTVTLDGASSSYLELRLHEYTNESPTAPFDVVSSSAGSAAGTDGIQTTLVTTSPNELIYALATIEQGGVEGTGFTLRTGVKADVSEDRQVGAPGTYLATATETAGNAWTITAVAFRPR
jgi:hypothetical protein